MMIKINLIRIGNFGKKLYSSIWILLLSMGISFGANAQDFAKSDRTDEELLGKWTIDLRPTPDSDAYYQVFHVESIKDNTFIGTFYGSPIEGALINRNWDKLFFAFSTADQNNEYFHSGYIENGKVFGVTYCPDREFTAPWNGNKD